MRTAISGSDQSIWKAGEPVMDDRALAIRSLESVAKSADYDAQYMNKASMGLVAGASIALLGMIGMAAVGASGGLAAPIVAASMQALFGGSVGLLASAFGAKMAANHENTKSNAAWSAGNLLSKGHSFEFAAEKVEMSGLLGAKGFAKRLGLRRSENTPAAPTPGRPKI